MLADSGALEDVVLGSGGLVTSGDGRAGRTLVDMSTVAVDASARVGAAAAAAGIGYLRAPVSGNPVAVRSGALGIVASGDAAIFERVKQLLADIGPTIFYLGEGEAARVMKLALNLMVAGTAELLAESIAFGEAHGLDRARMLEVIAGSAVGSPFVKYKTGPLVAGDYSSTFSSRLMRKDLGMALSAADGAGLPLPVTSLVDELLEDCVSSGMGDLDFMALLPRLQRAAEGPVQA
jgi:3-hydroxyisobutyrate dehydrogenase-like beta-hydroxyacid dehydrogenase